eukprot:2425168-Rhodomonas_salina.1
MEVSITIIPVCASRACQNEILRVEKLWYPGYPGTRVEIYPPGRRVPAASRMEKMPAKNEFVQDLFCNLGGKHNATLS